MLREENFDLKSALTKEKGVNSKLDAEYEEFKKSNYFEYFEEIRHLIQQPLSLDLYIPNEVISFYKEKYLIVQDSIFSYSEFRYFFTEKGHYFWEKYLEEKNSK